MTEPLKNEATAQSKPPVGTTAPATSVVETKTIDPKDILRLLTEVAELKKVVNEKAVKTAEAVVEIAEEIDWSKITDAQVADLDFPIPVYEHEIPEYMTIHLRDNNFIAKWIHTSPRRLGSKLAEGYSEIHATDWDPNYPQILPFNSEGKLIYEDVIGLKIHKSRYFGMIRREQLKSMQLKNVAGYNKVKGAINQAIANNPRMESAINRGAMTFYGEGVESAIEQVSI